MSLLSLSSEIDIILVKMLNIRDLGKLDYKSYNLPKWQARQTTGHAMVS